MKLSQRAAYSGFWVFALSICNRLLGFIRMIVLARMLSPDDFGLMGFTLLAVAILESFSKTGIQSALIQKRESINDYLDTAWTLQALRGILLFIILFITAPYVGTFFNNPLAVDVTRIAAFAFLFENLTNIKVVFFTKELEFNKQFIYRISGTVADLGTAVLMAVLTKSVWALVYGLLAGHIVRAVVSYIVVPYRPRIRIDWDKGKELFNFGRWVFASSILLFFTSQGDDILVGKLISAAALGFYQMAYYISNMPATEITHVISQVSFPLYSKLQNDRESLQKAYLKIVKITAMISIPAGVLIFILTPDLVSIILGEKWAPVIMATQILCLYGILRANGSTGAPLVLSLGKPKILTAAALIHFIILFSLLYPLTVSFGIEGTSAAVVISFAVLFIPCTIINCRLISVKFVTWLRCMISPASASMIMLTAVYLAKTHLLNSHVSPAGLVFLIILGLIVYLPIIILFEREFLRSFRDIFKKMQPAGYAGSLRGQVN